MGEDDHIARVTEKSRDVARRVVDVQVGVHGPLLPHEAEVPVGDAVEVQPFHRLGYGDAVEVLDDQAVGDDADAQPSIGEAGQGRAGPGDHAHVPEEVAIDDGEAGG